MAFKHLVILSTICLGGALAGDCMSSNGPKCMRKSEVGPYEQFMVGGDPCFLYSGNRWCFTSLGRLAPCTCTAECGCEDAATVKPAPKCDDQSIPASFDCDKTKYCGDGYGATNTLCIFCGVDKAQCNSVCQYGLTDDEKKQIVDKHNELRRKVAKGQESINNQPKAANMNELVWDDELALSAQRFTDQCQSGHDKNRNLPKFKNVGQNFAMKASSQSLADNDVQSFVQKWYDEVKDFKPSSISPFTVTGENTGVVGHYTQVVWAETKYIGCGFIHFNKDGWYTKHLICNYGPAANLIGGTMYVEGEPGSACANGSNDGLCQ